MTDALAIEGLRKSFGSLEVLRGIDLAVAEHEVVCLIGASGSGKSTLLRCVNLVEPIDRGRIVVGGEEITARGVDANRIRRRRPSGKRSRSSSASASATRRANTPTGSRAGSSSASRSSARSRCGPT